MRVLFSFFPNIVKSRYRRTITGLTLIVFIIWWRTSSIFQFPEPTGKYSVGTTVYYFKDESRQEVHAVNGGFRELLVQFWYPSIAQKNNNISPYVFDTMPNLGESIRKLYAYNYVPNFIFSYFITGIYTHAIKEAPLCENKEKYPVIIFSHGYGSLTNFNSTQLEELASHGYIVVGINHTYDCCLTVFPDGRVIPLSNDWQNGQINYLSKEINFWVKDVLFVLDQLEKLNINDPKKIFNGKLDFSRVGALGHSMGGATTTQICRIDRRIKAGINMDGPLFGKNATKGFSKPFMFLLAEESIQMAKRNLTEDELSFRKMSLDEAVLLKKYYGSNIPDLCNNMQSDTYSVVVKGAGHYSFSDLPLFKRVSLFFRYFNFGVGSLDPYRAVEITNSYILQFFNKYLKNKVSPLFDENKCSAEVEVTRWINKLKVA